VTSSILVTVNTDNSRLLRAVAERANSRILAGVPKNESLSDDDITASLMAASDPMSAIILDATGDSGSDATIPSTVIELRKLIELTRNVALSVNSVDFRVLEYAIAESRKVQSTLRALFPGEDLELETLQIGSDEIVIGQYARYLILLTLQARACVVAQEVYALIRFGLIEGAHARCRTLYEVLIITAIIEEDVDCALSNRVQGAAVSEYRKFLMALNLRSDETKLSAVHPDFERVDERVRLSQSIFGNLTRAYEWTRPLFPNKKVSERILFSDLEDYVGATYMRASHIAMHWDVHVTPRSIVNASDLSSDEIVQSTGVADERWTREICKMVVRWISAIGYSSLSAVCWLTESYDDMYAVSNLLALGDYYDSFDR